MLKNIALFYIIYNKQVYSKIPKQDRISSILEGIFESLSYFDVNKDIKFMAYCSKYIHTRLCDNIIYATRKRRNGVVCSLDEMVENAGTNYEMNFIKDYDNSFDCVDDSDMLNDIDLSVREKIMCKAIMENPNISNVELAEVLKCHRHTVAKERNVLKIKLASCL